MKPKKIYTTALIIIIMLGMSLQHFNQEASGVVIPDYDIFTSETTILLDEETGIGTFQVSLESHCAHTITVEVSNSCPGLSVSPQVSTVTIGPGASTDINVAVASSKHAPYSVSQLDVHARVTRIDGIAVSDGKERNAQVVIITPRRQNISSQSATFDMKKGEISVQHITVENTGNANDYVYLEVHEESPISCWFGTNMIKVSSGDVQKYPIIIAVPKDASLSSYSIDYILTSHLDNSVSVQGKFVVNIEEKKNGETDNSLFSGFLIPGIGLILLFLAVMVSRNQDFTVGTGRNSVLSILVFTTLLGGGFGGLTIQDGQAQISNDVSIEVHPGEVKLDVSPFTDDYGVIGHLSLTVNSQSSMEQVVQASVIVPDATVGYVREHRVPAGGSVTFPIGIAAMKESAYRVDQGNVQIQVIEVAGVPTSGSGGGSISTGFIVSTAPYSVPLVNTADPILSVKENGETAFEVELVNDGNTIYSYNLNPEPCKAVDIQGFNITTAHATENLDIGEKTSVQIHVKSPGIVKGKYLWLPMGAENKNENENDSGKSGEHTYCSVILENKDFGKEDEDDDLIYGFQAAMVIIVIMGVGMFRKWDCN